MPASQGVAALGPVERRQVVETRGQLGMIGAELSLAQLKRLLGEGKHGPVAALGVQLDGALVCVDQRRGLAVGGGGPEPQNGQEGQN